MGQSAVAVGTTASSCSHRHLQPHPVIWLDGVEMIDDLEARTVLAPRVLQVVHRGMSTQHVEAERRLVRQKRSASHDPLARTTAVWSPRYSCVASTRVAEALAQPGRMADPSMAVGSRAQ